MSGLTQMPPLQAPASVDLSGNQYFFVVLDSSGELALAGANEANPYVLMDAPGAGLTGTFETPHGQRLTVIAGEALAVGELVSVDAAGKAHDADTTGDAIIGQCIVGGALDEEVQIIFTGQGVLVL